MPPKKTTTKPADVEEKDVTPPAEVDNTENGEENGGEVNEKHSPIDDIEVPTTDNTFAASLIDRIVSTTEDIENDREVILNNSVTDAGIKNYVENDISDSELVALRTENDNTENRIKELVAELDKLRTKSGEIVDSMHAIARKNITANMDVPAKTRAEQGVKKGIEKLGSYTKLLREEIDVDVPENKSHKDFLTAINSLVYGGQTSISTSGNGGGSGNASPAKRARAKRIREWASINGIKVNEKGRLPEWVLTRYAEAVPEDKEGLE